MDERSRRRGLLYFFSGISIAATLAVAGEGGTELQPWPFGVRVTVPAYVLVALGFISGTLVTRAVSMLHRDGTGAVASVAVVLLCAGVMASVAVRAEAFPAAAALLIVLLGGAGVIVAEKAVRLIQSGDAFELQTHWGGLGGGLGGWRLSPATSLVLLSMFFGAGALGICLRFAPGPASRPGAGVADASDSVPAPSQARSSGPAAQSAPAPSGSADPATSAVRH